MKYLSTVVFAALLLHTGCSSGTQTETRKEAPKFTSSYARASEYSPAVEKMPVPIGGIGEIQKQVVFPESLKNEKIDVMVYVMAFLNEEGIVDFAEIRKGFHPDCDKEALRAVREAKFVPGSMYGTKVKTVVVVPIIFRN